MYLRKPLLPKHWPFLLPILALSLLLSACSAWMPKEVRQTLQRTSAIAVELSSKHPDLSHDYKIADRNIHYVEISQGPAKPLIIFIHGSPGDWRAWVEYLRDPELQQKSLMVAVDRPGFGGSGAGIVERSLEQQCRELAPILDQASPGQRILLVGHSYGGPVAARLAMDHPDKVTDLVLLAGSIDPGQEHTAWYQYPADWPPFSWLVPTELLVANREIRHLKGDLTEMLPLWSKITQRVTLIQGEKDDLVPPENADFAARMITHAQSFHIIRVPNQNHFLPWNQYKLVKSTILEHLE